MLWTGRAHFSDVLQRALGRVAAGKGEGEVMLSYPVAFWGFLLTFAYMVGFCCLAGVRVDVALALWITYLIFAIGLTRVAAEGAASGRIRDVDFVELWRQGRAPSLRGRGCRPGPRRRAGRE